MRRPVRTDLLILTAVALLLAAAYAVYFVLRHPEKLSLNLEADRVLLTVLAVTMALLLAGLLFLLLRNLIKLIVERRRQVLGSRFRTKLVFIFMVLVLMPSVALFYAAVNLIQQVNEALFTEPLEQITADSKKIVDSYTMLVRRDCGRVGSRIAEEIAARRLLEPVRRSDLESRIGSWRAREDLDFIAVFEGQGPPDGVPQIALAGIGDAPQDDAEVRGLGRQGSVPAALGGGGPRLVDLAGEAIRTGNPTHRLDRTGHWQRAAAVVPIPSLSPFRAASGAVIVGRYIAPETAERTERVDRAYREYRKALNRQPDIRRVTIQLFAILTLLVLFAATWAGFYLARQITVPIQALAEGTQAISAGNLDHRVTAQAGDEIGYLIDSFNRMTEELRSSREAITTSRQKLEQSYQQLEDRREYIEQLLENVPAAVISLDARGWISTMNRAAYRTLRLDPEKPVSGLPAREAFQQRDLLPLLHEIENLTHGEAVGQVQELEISLDGQPVHLAVNLSPRRDAEGRFQGALIVMEDLTPLIRAQRTAAWREVARRIAHEIKNPLTPIQLSAQRVLKKFREEAEDFPRVLEEGTQSIVKEVSTLKSLVDEFSRFARMPAVSLVPGDPNAVVEAALSLYDGLHPGIVFRCELAPSPPLVPLDAEQMKRVLINLVDNSIAAMDGRGAIALRTRVLVQERVFKIEVEDDGPGIDPENKSRLFVPYFSTKKRGTGLGLAIANRIVSDHNGFIRVEDNTPRGARFVIDLPL